MSFLGLNIYILCTISFYLWTYKAVINQFKIIYLKQRALNGLYQDTMPLEIKDRLWLLYPLVCFFVVVVGIWYICKWCPLHHPWCHYDRQGHGIKMGGFKRALKMMMMWGPLWAHHWLIQRILCLIMWLNNDMYCYWWDPHNKQVGTRRHQKLTN